jgi:transposase-like protein
MRKDIVGEGPESTAPTFENLETLVREQVQAFIQRILEEEVTELLGREKSERIEGVDVPRGTGTATAGRGT